MRIATYNVNGINGRLSSLLEWLKETAPGVVCLQELKAPDDKFPEAALRASGYDAVWHGQKSWEYPRHRIRAIYRRERRGASAAHSRT